MVWILPKLSNYQQVAPSVRTGGSRHTGLAAPPHRNIQYAKSAWVIFKEVRYFLIFSPKEIVGHSSTTTLNRFYSHSFLSKKAEALKKSSDFFESLYPCDNPCESESQ